MRLTIKEETAKPIDLTDIEKFESEIGYKIPSEYKKFLIKYSGSETGEEIFKFKYYQDLNEYDTSWDVEFKLLDFNDLEILRSYGFEGESDEDYDDNCRRHLRISTLQGGCEGIYLSLDEYTYGYIYWADKTHGYNFTLLAKTLDEFLNSFESPEEYV